MAKYEIGSVVESQTGRIFVVSEFPEPEMVVLSNAELTENQRVTQRILDSYKVLPDLGLKANRFLNIDLLRDWVESAPLRLLYAVLIDQPTPARLSEKDVQQSLRTLVTRKHKWGVWWEKTRTLLSDNPCSVWTVGSDWMLKVSHQQPEALALPIWDTVSENRSQSDGNTSIHAERKHNNPLSQSLSENVVQLVSGLVDIGDIKVSDRPKVVKRLIEDGVWWWLNSIEGLSQIAQYDRTINEFLNSVTNGYVPVTQSDLLLKLIPLLTTKNASNRLLRVLDATRLIAFEKPHQIPNKHEWQTGLFEVLLDTSINLQGDSESYHLAFLEISQFLGDLLNDSPVLVQPFIDRLETCVETAAYEKQKVLSQLIRRLLQALDRAVRSSIATNLSLIPQLREGIWLFLSEDQSIVDSIETIRDLMALSHYQLNETACNTIQGLAGSLAERIKDDRPDDVIHLCMNILSIGCTLNETLDNNMQLAISDRKMKSLEESKADLVIGQMLQAFQKEINKQISVVEQRFKREISKLTSVNDRNNLHILDLASQLESEKQFANRLKNERGASEKELQFYSKIQLLTPWVELHQGLIMQQTRNPNDTKLDSYTLERFSEILEINGVHPMQQVGEILEYEPYYHDRIESSVNPLVTVVSPGFHIQNHQGEMVVIRKAYVKDN